MTTMILCALLAAVLYGVGAALEQHQAAGAPDSAAGRPRLLALLVRQPAWVLGLAAQVGGFAAHAAALRSGPLTIVQMLLAAELVVSVAVVRVRSGGPLPPKAWAAGAAVAGGIASFLAVSTMALCTTFSHGVAGSWPVYAVVLLPVVAAVTPMASVAIGVGFLGQPLSGNGFRPPERAGPVEGAAAG